PVDPGDERGKHSAGGGDWSRLARAGVYGGSRDSHGGAIRAGADCAVGGDGAARFAEGYGGVNDGNERRTGISTDASGGRVGAGDGAADRMRADDAGVLEIARSAHGAEHEERDHDGAGVAAVDLSERRAGRCVLADAGTENRAASGSGSGGDRGRAAPGPPCEYE